MIHSSIPPPLYLCSHRVCTFLYMVLYNRSELIRLPIMNHLWCMVTQRLRKHRIIIINYMLYYEHVQPDQMAWRGGSG